MKTTPKRMKRDPATDNETVVIICEGFSTKVKFDQIPAVNHT